MIVEIQTQQTGSISLEAYRRYKGTLGPADQRRFDDRLRGSGFVITGFASGLQNRHIGADISVVEKLGQPIVLRELACAKFCNSPIKNGDQVMEFSTSPTSWRSLSGRAGVALVRNDVVVDVRIEVMN
jgi:hypothetical protein